MLLKFLFVSLACCALVNAAVLNLNSQQTPVEHSVNDVFMSFAEAFKINPTLTTECFNNYGPKMKFITELYKDNVDKCQSDAEDGRKGADKDVADKRASIASDVAGLCLAFSTCNTNDIAMNYFQCYSTSGNVGARTSNSISYKANEAIEYINIRYAVIETQMNNCTNNAAEDYNFMWSIYSENLDRCLKDEKWSNNFIH